MESDRQIETETEAWKTDRRAHRLREIKCQEKMGLCNVYHNNEIFKSALSQKDPKRFTMATYNVE